MLKDDILDQNIVTQQLKNEYLNIHYKGLSIDTKPTLGCKQHYKKILNCSDMLHISNSFSVSVSYD